MNRRWKPDPLTLAERLQSFTAAYVQLDAQRHALAQDIMHACAKHLAINKDHTWVTFLRTLDPTIPTNPTHYREHSTYKAADVIRRILPNATTTQARRKTR